MDECWFCDKPPKFECSKCLGHFCEFHVDRIEDDSVEEGFRVCCTTDKCKHSDLEFIEGGNDDGGK